MQWPKINTSDCAGEAKSYSRHSKPAGDSMSQQETGVSVLQQLLAASKDAERLIGCCFELHMITANPLEQIWDNLARAIKSAQQTLRGRNRNGSSGHHALERKIRQRGL